MRQDPDILRTPHPDCPACRHFRLHSDDEQRAFHPMAGHGYAKEVGWTHPDLEPKT